MELKFGSIAEACAEPVTWLWHNYVPHGGITVVEGMPGTFKTSVLIDLAARTSNGSPMPFSEATMPAASVLILNAEDTIGSLKARLQFAGADMNRIFVPLNGSRPRLPDDFSDLHRLVNGKGVKLILVDPLASFAAAALSADAPTRKLMDGLTEFAQRYSLAIVCIRHWIKGTATQTLYRAAGSHSITAAARSELIFAENAANRAQRILAQLKSNLATLSPSLIFGAISHEQGVRIHWQSTTPITALKLVEATAPKDRPALEEAKRILFSILGDGPVTAKAAEALARQAGITSSTLRRAKEGLKILSKRRGFGPSSQFFWQLPPREHPAVAAQWQAEIDHLGNQLFNGETDADVVIYDGDEPSRRGAKDAGDRQDDGDNPAPAFETFH